MRRRAPARPGRPACQASLSSDPPRSGNGCQYLETLMPLTKLGRGGGVALAVDLLNSWDELEPEPDLLSPRWLRRYLEFHGFAAASARIGEADVALARELRERLRRGFDAATEEEAVDALNPILREFGEPP